MLGGLTRLALLTIAPCTKAKRLKKKRAAEAAEAKGSWLDVLSAIGRDGDGRPKVVTDDYSLRSIWLQPLLQAVRGGYRCRQR